MFCTDYAGGIYHFLSMIFQETLRANNDSFIHENILWDVTFNLFQIQLTRWPNRLAWSTCTLESESVNYGVSQSGKLFFASLFFNFHRLTKLLAILSYQAYGTSIDRLEGCYGFHIFEVCPWTWTKANGSHTLRRTFERHIRHPLSGEIVSDQASCTPSPKRS